MLPSPVVETRDGFLIVRDDLLPGGTKRRGIPALFAEHPGKTEFVYASPVQGYAQIALAFACADAGKKGTVFLAKRAIRHPRTLAAIEAGANVVEVAPGYLTNVQAKARVYCRERGAVLLPFGLDCEEMIEALADVARSLRLAPSEVWVASGSGTLTRALQRAWPEARHFAVQVGKEPWPGKADLLVAPEKFEQDAKEPPPFPSCGNYDAKVWRFFRERAKPGALFWNVGA